MRQERKTKLLQGLIITFFLSAAAIVVLGASPIQFASLQSSLCGVSADDVSISSNNAEISGTAWVVEAVGGCSDHIIEGGTLVQKENLEGEDPDTGQTGTAEEDFQIGLTSFDAWAYNKISSTDSAYPILRAEYKTFDSLDSCHNWQAETPASTSDLEFARQIAWWEGGGYHCFRAQKEGEITDLESTTYTDFNAEFTMEAAGSRYSTDVTSEERGAKLGEGEQSAYITWTGSLLKEIIDVNLDTSKWKASCDTECANPISEVDWKVVPQTQISNYETTKTGFKNEVDQVLEDGQDPQTAVNHHNSVVDTTLSDWSNGLENELGTWVRDVKFVSNELRILAEDASVLQAPQFTIRVDTDWIGFNIPVADPVINDVPSIQMDAQSSATASVTVTNEGDVGGRVLTSISCPNPLTDGSSENYLSPGQQSTYNIRIDAGVSPTTTYTCDVVAQDIDSESTKDTATLNVDVTSSCQDSDGDGVCDRFDSCENEVGPESNNGCPIEGENDRDNDGIPDSKDECPTQPENYNLYQDSDGCPDNQPDIDQEICNNGVDDDGDGRVDQADPDCQDDSNIPWIPLGIMAFVLGIAAIFRETITEFVGNLR